MIIRSTFRGPGGLAAHLMRTDTNEMVRVREDLSTGCALEVGDALSDFVALGDLHGAQKPLVHFVVSPSAKLDQSQEGEMLRQIRAEYGIADDHPLIMVEHFKPGATDRESHYHFVLPRVDPATGRQIKDGFNKAKNERLSLTIAHDLGHELVAGPRIEMVRNRLNEERPDMKDALAMLERPGKMNDKTTVNDKDQAHQHSADIATFDARTFNAFFAQNGKIKIDQALLNKSNLKLYRGNKTVLTVDSTTGFSQSLVRVLSRESKRRGLPNRLKAADIEKALAGLNLPQFDNAAIVSAAVEKAADSLKSAIRTVKVEAGRDFDVPTLTMAKRAKASDDELKTEMAARRDRTIKSDLSAIRQRSKNINDLNFRAVQTARRRSRFWHRHRKLVGLATGAVVLATGFGIPTAVTALIIARGTIAHKKSQADQTKVKRADIKAETARYFERVKAASKFDLNEIPRAARAAAGAVYQVATNGQEPDVKIAEALDRAAPGLSMKLIELAKYGQSPSVDRILTKMYDFEDPAAVKALAAFVASQKPETPVASGKTKVDMSQRPSDMSQPPRDKSHWPDGTPRRSKTVKPPAGHGGPER